MAKRTKHLIELGDVKAVVLRCRHCESSVSFSVARDRRVPMTCPACGGDWDTTMSPRGFNALVAEYMARHKGLQDAFGTPAATSNGYTISLEVDLGDQKPQTSNSVDIPAPSGR